jgi:hypothetical protein
LLEKFGNVVIAGITSNLKMNGIPLPKSENAIKNSVVKLNHSIPSQERCSPKSHSSETRRKTPHI